MVPGRWASHQHGAVQIQRKLARICLNSGLPRLVEAFWFCNSGRMELYRSVPAVCHFTGDWSSPLGIHGIMMGYVRPS